MATQRYAVTPQPIESLLTWVKTGAIATPRHSVPRYDEVNRQTGHTPVDIRSPQELEHEG